MLRSFALDRVRRHLTTKNEHNFMIKFVQIVKKSLQSLGTKKGTKNFAVESVI
jgi:hypothetical protein